MTKYVLGVAEIVLWTANKDEALSFYHDLLGFDVISEPELANSFLKVGEGHAEIPQMIVLVPMDESLQQKPRGLQLHHLAFELAPGDFDEQRKLLENSGLEVRDGKHPVLASRTMYVDDPDGNEVEFICREKAS